MTAKKSSKKGRASALSRMDLAAPVSERVEVLEILLAESVTRRGTIRDHLPALTINVNVETDVDKKEKVVCVRPRFAVSARYEEANGEEVLRIEATFVLRYRVPSLEGLDTANFTAFGELNGIYNAWPYWREFVQSTTVRMGLPPLTIPVYRPVKMQKRSTKSRGHKKRSA